MIYMFFVAFVLAFCFLLGAWALIEVLIGRPIGPPPERGATTYTAYGQDVSAREWDDVTRGHAHRTTRHTARPAHLEETR